MENEKEKWEYKTHSKKKLKWGYYVFKSATGVRSTCGIHKKNTFSAIHVHTSKADNKR